MHVPIAKASISQAKSWAYGNKKPPKPTSQKIEVQRLIEEVEPYAEDENTSLEEAILASRAEDEKHKG